MIENQTKIKYGNNINFYINLHLKWNADKRIWCVQCTSYRIAITILQFFGSRWWCRCSPSQFSSRSGRFHWHWSIGAAIYTRSENRRCFAALRQLHHLHRYVRHRWLFPSISDVVYYPLATQLWKLHIGSATMQPNFSDNSMQSVALCSTESTLQLVWCSGFDLTNVSLTSLHDAVLHRLRLSPRVNYRLCFGHWTVCLRHTWIS